MTPIEKVEHCLCKLKGQLYTNEGNHFVMEMADACDIQAVLEALREELSDDA